MEYFEYLPEENPFPVVYVDLTHRCNMACANCYVPNRSVPDLSKSALYESLLRLRSPTEIRLIGGEATLRLDLAEIISFIQKLGHRTILVTNGLKLSDPLYVKELKGAGLKYVYISMNGADLDEIYLQTDQMICAEKKMQALQNCSDLKLKIGIGVILMKGKSEQIPKRIIEIASASPSQIKINFRNVGQLGRYALEHHQNYSITEMISLISSATGLDSDFIAKYRLSRYQFRFPYRNGKKSIWIMITDWSPGENELVNSNVTGRGRLTQDFKIAPFFQHVKKFENHY
jgi:MoaA/NifB/PqqE/SkfB family radical SAM enzyme